MIVEGFISLLFFSAVVLLIALRRKLKSLRRSERELKNSEERLNLTLNTAKVGTWEWDLEHDVWLLSPSYYSILGYDPQPGPADQAAWLSLMHPDDREMVSRRIAEARNQESESYEYEARVLGADGAYRWHRITGFGIQRGSDGKIRRMLGINKDISKKKVVEDALELNERRLRNIFEESPISIWEEDFSQVRERIEEARNAGAVDWDDYFRPRERIEEFAALIRILDVNKSTVRLLECADKAEALRKLPDFLDQSAVDTFRSELIALASGRTSFECESMLNTAKGGRVFLQLRLNIAPGHERDWKCVLVSLVDLSDRKAAERALEESEAKYRGLVEQSSDGILLIDSSGTVLDCNPIFEALAGTGKERITGRKVWETTPSLMPAPFRSPEEVGILAAKWKNGIEAGLPVQHFESAVKEDSGVQQIIEHALYPIFHKGNLLIGDIMRDVTEQRQASEALRSSLQEKELLLQEIHHRVKNNLQIICSLINLQMGKIGEGNQAECGLRDTENRVRSMAFVHELLYQSDEFAAIDFSAYVRRLSDFLIQAYEAEDERIRLEFSLDRVSIPIDKAIPCGLIMNELISNALKHAFPEGRSGTIQVRLSRQADGFVELTVQDDGIGFAAGKRGGIGLTLVESLTAQLHGRLEIEDDGGRLTRVAFPI